MYVCSDVQKCPGDSFETKNKGNEHLVTQSMVWGGVNFLEGGGQNSSLSEFFETDQHIL